jgi:hypothetical protein
MKSTYSMRDRIAREARRLSENEKFFARLRKAKILTAGIHLVF